MGFPGGSAGKESSCNVGELGSIPGLGRSPGEGNGYPPQYSGLENSIDCIVHGVTKSRTHMTERLTFNTINKQFLPGIPSSRAWDKEQKIKNNTAKHQWLWSSVFPLGLRILQGNRPPCPCSDPEWLMASLPIFVTLLINRLHLLGSAPQRLAVQ